MTLRPEHPLKEPAGAAHESSVELAVAVDSGRPDVDSWSGDGELGESTSHVREKAVLERGNAELDFDGVYTRFFAHVSRWVRAFGAPAAEVDDLVQETFLVVERKLGGFDGRNLSAWLYRIAQRTVSDHRRRAWFRRLLQRADRDLDSLAASDRGPGESLERREAQRIVSQVLDRMSAVRRTAFVLFEIEGYRCEEIAELEQVPVNTVYTRLHHARKDFLKFVAEATGEPMEELP